MINELIKRATDALKEQHFTRLTIRMNFLNYWRPFEAEQADRPFSRELVQRCLNIYELNR